MRDSDIENMQQDLEVLERFHQESQSREKTLSDAEKLESKAFAQREGKNLQDHFLFFITILCGFSVIIIGGLVFLTYLTPQIKEVRTFKTPVTENITFKIADEPNVFDPFTKSFDSIDNYSSQSVVVFDLKANKTVFSKNADKKTYVASLTKLASVKVLSDNVNSDGITEIDETNSKIGGSTLVLKQGQKFKNSDLIKASIVASSNQAVFALQSPETTISQMNDYAKALHLQSTTFTNPAGFDDIEFSGNYSSAKDLIPVTKLFFKNDQVKLYSKLSKTDIFELTESKTLNMQNTNDLIRLNTPGVIAGKTGTTVNAGQNLMLLVEKNNRQYLIILLNGIDRYQDAYKVLDRL